MGSSSATWPWITRTQLAEALGCSTRNFDERVRARLPRDAMKGRGKALRYNLIACVKAWVDHQVELNTATDDLMGGPAAGSQALENYRNEKFIEAKRKNDEQAKLICNREIVVEALTSGIQAMRRTAQKLESMPTITGKEARSIFDEGVDAFEKAAVKALSTDTDPITPKEKEVARPKRARARKRAGRTAEAAASAHASPVR